MGCIYSKARRESVDPIDSSDFDTDTRDDSPYTAVIDAGTSLLPSPDAPRPSSRLTITYTHCAQCNIYAAADSFFVLATTKGYFKVCSRSCKMTLVKRNRLVEVGVTPPREEGRNWFV